MSEPRLSDVDVSWLDSRIDSAVASALTTHTKGAVASASPAGLSRELVTALAKVTREHVARQIAREVSSLAARITVLEARPELKYAGTYRPGETYSPGSLTTHKGSLWFAQCDDPTADAPGSSPNWRLIVKSGTASAP